MSYGSLDTGRDKPSVVAKSLNIGPVKPEELHDATIDRTKAEWEKMTNDILRVKDHPRAAEYEKISAKAVHSMEIIKLSLDMPGGYRAIELEAEKLADLYQQAIIIRGQVAHDNIVTAMGVAPGTDLESALGVELDTAEDATGSLGENIRTEIDRILRALDTNPADVIDGTAVDNIFYVRQFGRADINMRAVQNTEKFLAGIQSNPAVAPAFASVTARVQSGIDEMKANNIAMAEQYEWYNKNFAGKKINGEPLRILLGLTASVVFTIGMIQFLFTKKFSPATAGWGIAALACIKPGFFQGSAQQSLDAIAAMGGPEVHKSVAAGFKGETAALAVEELQDIRRSDATLLNALSKSRTPLSDAQIGELAGEDSSLMKIFATIKEKDRSAVLRTFGRRMDLGEVELAQSMLRG